MEMEMVYPVLIVAFILYINSVPKELSIMIYLLISVYYYFIRPIYGLLSAVILLLIHNTIEHKRVEGFTKGEIPKVIYQTWHSKTLPPKMTECVEKLKSDNPGFKYYLYDDADCRAFIEANFDPEVLYAYDSLLPGAFKADLWRYCVLYINGGFYVDIKFICEPGFSFSQIKDSQFYVREYNHKGTGLYDHIVYTGVIGSRPKNPLFDRCIKQICENVREQFYGPEHTSPTGPWLFAKKMDPKDIENIEYSYYEEDGIGHIRHIKQHNVIMSHYPEYRREQKSNSKSSYWKDAWLNREIYRSLDKKENIDSF